MNRLLRELRHLVIRSHLREIHFSYATLDNADRWALLRGLFDTVLGRRPSNGQTTAECEEVLSATLGVSTVVTCNSARNALRMILQVMDIGPGDEVVLPGFTCVVVPYAIRHYGATPVYVDIKPDYRMDLDAVRRVLSPKTKAILAQHTFGLPERMADLMALAREKGIRVIEDCAHTLGTMSDGRMLGAWGDAAFFSFEITKPISCGWGGAAVTSDVELGQRLRQMQAELPPIDHTADVSTQFQLVLATLLYHPGLYSLGRFVLAGLYRLGVLPISIPLQQRRGGPPKLLGRLTDSQASLLLRQLHRLPTINKNRQRGTQALAEHFAQQLDGPQLDLPLLRYPLQVTQRDDAVDRFRRHQIELGQWFQAPLHPADCDMAYAGYQPGSCPVAEELSRGCVNLSTLVSGADLERILSVTDQYLLHNQPARSVGEQA